MNQTLQDLFEDGLVALMVVVAALFVKFVFDSAVSVEWLPMNVKTFGALVATLLAIIGFGSLFMVSRENAKMFAFVVIFILFGYGSVITDQTFLPGYYLSHAVLMVQGNAIGWEPFRYGMAFVSLIGVMFGLGAVGGILRRISKATFAKTTLSQRRNKAERVNDSTFGEARWMSMEKLRRDFTGLDGIVLGEAYDPNLIGEEFKAEDRKTWGRGGQAELVVMPTSFATGHSLIFAGSNGFKSTGFVMPNALSFKGGLFVVDPKGEIAATAGPVRAKSGRQVEIISAFEGLDPVEFLRPLWHGQNDTEIFTNLAEWIVGEGAESADSSAAFFNESCRNMLAGILAYYAYGGHSNVIGMSASLFGTDQKTVGKLLGAFAEETQNQFVAKMLHPFKSMADATLSGIIATVNKSIGFANHSRMAKFFDGNSRIRRFSDDKIGTEEADVYGRLLSASVDIYLQIPLETITSHPQLVRVFLGAFAKRYMRQDMSKAKVSRLLIVDEAGRLQRMSLLEVIRDTGRAQALHVMMIYQSLGQLYLHYKSEGARAWFDSAAAISFSCTQDVDNLKKISELVGSYTAMIKSTSTSKRGLVIGGAMSNDMTRGASESLREVKLMSTDEIRTMRDDEQILMFRGKDPVRCGKAIYFRREGWGDELDVLPIKPTFDLPDGDGDSAGAKLQKMFREHSGQFLKVEPKQEAATDAAQNGSEAGDTEADGDAGTDAAGTDEQVEIPNEVLSIIGNLGRGQGKLSKAQVAALNDAQETAAREGAMKEIRRAEAAEPEKQVGNDVDRDQALGRI